MRWVIVLMMMAFFVPMYANQDDADRYVREAEYYQKKADGYRRGGCLLSEEGRAIRKRSGILHKEREDRYSKNLST